MTEIQSDSLSLLRRRLHAAAELSNQEARTAALIRAELEATAPDELVTELGGHGLAAVYGATEPGPTVLLRADLDALPIGEELDLEHASRTAGVAHKCGHDGHMAIQVGVARRFAVERPARGRVVVLFQPAEETGEGAARVLADPRFAALAPDLCLAAHNLPGAPLGTLVVRPGTFACASTGLVIHLSGTSSHAAEPENGASPVFAASTLAMALSAIPQRHVALHELCKVTIVGLEVGGPYFGTSPGNGRVMATLRAETDALLDEVLEVCERYARGTAAANGLEVEIETVERFPATVNDPAVIAAAVEAAQGLGMAVERRAHPYSWSEDFGHFTARFPGALLGLGSGLDQPPLHHPDFDFPDALLEPSVELFVATAKRLAAATNARRTLSNETDS